MKKLVLVFLLLFLLPFASAAFSCSNETDSVVQDRKSVDEAGIKTVNGFSIAVTAADESKALSRVAADFLIDADEVFLSNDSLSGEVTLASTVYSVELLNATDDVATVRVDGEAVAIEEGRVSSVKSLFAFLADARKVDVDGEPSARVIVGTSRVFLSSDSQPLEKVGEGNSSFFISIVSGSDTDATISVRKCEYSEIVEVEATPNITVGENATAQNNSVGLNVTNQSVISPGGGSGNASNSSQGEEVASPPSGSGFSITSQKEGGVECTSDSHCQEGFCDEGVCAKRGLFARMWHWLKGVLS